ncbi:MAG: glycosyl hydrolase family 18 protein [Actinomycetota bacterium]
MDESPPSSADDTPVVGTPPIAARPSDGAHVDTDGSIPVPGDGAMVDADATPQVSTRPSTGSRRRSMTLAVIGILVVVAVAGGLWWSSRPDPPPPPKPDIPLDAWAPYWTLDDSLPDAERRIPSMREVSPFWFEARGVETIAVSEFADPEATERFVDIARSSDADVVPSIVDLTDAREMAAIIADPATRTRHIDALVDFTTEGDFDGIDVNYENFAFVDGRDTWEATRPNWVAFIEELSGRLRADGRSLTVSIPPIYDTERNGDSGFWVYDHGAIAPFVDRIRVMAYDFSVGEPGPIAPLGFVENSIDGVVEATGDPGKVVLGLAAYGRNWPIATTGACPEGEEVPGRTTVTARTVDDLIARRGATPILVPDTGEWTFTYDLEITDGITTCVQTRQVHYVDADGVRARMDLAREKQLDGVALWAFGFDDDAVWAEILPTVED